ncbi:hypothetical protein Dsin_018713 [Dipteronia sinensis]|uniref:DC1 domain-containing protein n=1 Tax=Dipteronia sinensis TaxID=43782 RepID=A0AAE0A6E7_9ROSI|nr:hypothetical protein Dsin_018713 [Dipteronia sinensis]
MHHLTLMPFTTLSATSFLCDSCSTPGTAFAYCCALCWFDLHVDCASLPQIMKFELHPHQLSLNYALPYNEVEASPHSCNIWNKVLDSKFWTYNCADCNFNVHICCATGKT